MYPGSDGEVCLQKPGSGDATRLDCASGFGAATFVTGTFGFVAASKVLQRLAKKANQPATQKEIQSPPPFPVFTATIKAHFTKWLDPRTTAKPKSRWWAYRALYGEYGLWVRPLEMFMETVNKEGQTQPRFALEKAF